MIIVRRTGVYRQKVGPTKVVHQTYKSCASDLQKSWHPTYYNVVHPTYKVVHLTYECSASIRSLQKVCIQPISYKCATATVHCKACSKSDWSYTLTFSQLSVYPTYSLSDQ